MGAAAKAVYELLFFVMQKVLGRVYFANLIATAAAILAAVFVYFAALIKLKGVSRNDILMLPKGQKILDLMVRKGLI